MNHCSLGYSYGAHLDYPALVANCSGRSAHIFIGMLRNHCVLIRSHLFATAGGAIIGLEALSCCVVRCNGSLGFSVSRWIAHWCIGVPLTYCVLFRSHRTRTLDGALSMLRQFVLIGALMLQQTLLLLTASCQSWSARGTS